MDVEADAAAVGHESAPASPVSPRRAPEFPGCRTMPLKCDEVATYEGRFEFWDAATETAWVVREPTSATHEYPSHRLSGLSEVIASVRGSAIRCFGAMDLELRDEHGERRRILQADQSVYLYPARSRLPDDAGMVLGEHDFPDVVVEVDHTTDVRRGKLWLYEEWGFPEVWVEVPDRYSPSRPGGRRAGLTIHRLEGGAYRTAPQSGAFPGWTAEAIHTALNEPSLSAATGRVLDRVGRTLGARDGTGPDDMPWLRAHRAEAHTRGRAEGRTEGRTEGRIEGRTEGRIEGRTEGRIEGRTEGRVEGRTEGRIEGRAEARAEIIDAFRRKLLASRGISGVSDEEIIDALLGCKDQTDFWARLEGPRR